MPQENLRTLVENGYKEAVRWVKTWSFVYHFFLFGAICCSAAAALAVEIELTVFGIEYKHIGALISGIAALMGTIAAAGGFRRKWIATRATMQRLYALKLDLTRSDYDESEGIEILKQIWKDHDERIVGKD